MKKLILNLALFAALTGALSAGEIVTYQGRLKESGSPVTANRSFVFEFCATEAGTGCIASTSGSQPFQVINGLFKSTFTAPAVNFAAGPWYLRVSVEGTPLSPLERLTHVPYAVQAASSAYASALSVASGQGVYASTNVAVSGSLTVSDFSIVPSTEAMMGVSTVLNDLNPAGEDVRVAITGYAVSGSPDADDVLAAGNFEAEVPAAMNGMMVGVRAVNRNSGSSPKAIGLMVDSLQNTGTLGETYGIWIATMTGGTQNSRPYALYSGDPNAATYFAGAVGISSVPAYSLAVSSGTGDIFWVAHDAVHAVKFVGDGSGLTGVTGASGTDNTKVLKAGDTMTGQLTLAGSTLTVTGNAFSVGTTGLVVTPAGVGVGTFPTNPFQVSAGGSQYVFAGNSTSADATMNLVHNAGGVARINDNSGTNAAIALALGHVNHVLLNNAGDLGIGAINPSYRLHVSSGAGEAGTVMAVSTGATNIFWVAGDGAHSLKFHGDGSALTGVSDTTRLLKAGDTMTGPLVFVQDTSLQSISVNTGGIIVSTGGAITTTGPGTGSVAGNVRGLGAVDLQTARGAATQVAAGNFSVIGGGIANSAVQSYATVGGGFSNYAGGDDSTVSGGYSNGALGYASAVGGGAANSAPGTLAAIAGGDNNSAQGYYAAIGGGAYNVVIGSNSAISGGRYNVLHGTSAVIAGGEYNSVSGMFSAIAGGASNSASSDYAAVGGGKANSAAGMYSAAAGGNYNSASGQMSAVGGGNNNSASGGFSAIPGGDTNQAMGLRSFAAGFRAQSTNDGTFTWGDSEGTMVLNSVTDRTRFKSRGGFLVSGSTDSVLTGQLNRGFLVTGNGLVGVSTGSPQAALDVVSDNSAVSLPVQIWRNSSGAVVSSMSSAGHMMAVRYVGDGSGLTGVTGALGLDASKVAKAGDTMTGQLTLAGSSLTVSNLGTQLGLYSDVGGGNISVPTGQSLYFEIGGSDRMHIDNLGNIAVNKSPANYRFDVGGAGNFDGQAIVGGTMTVMGSAFSVGGSTFSVNNGVTLVKGNYPLLLSDNAPYGGGFRHDQAGNETMVIAVRNPASKIVLATTFDVAAAPGASLAIPAAPELAISKDKVGVGTASPSYKLHVSSGAGESGTIMAVSTSTTNIFWVAGDGAHATAFYGSGTGLTGVPGDNLGTHNATQNLQMNWSNIYTVSTIAAAGHITAAAYQINGSTVLAMIPGGNSLSLGRDAGRLNAVNTSLFIGTEAGYSNISSPYNLFLGYRAGYASASGAGYNMFMGYEAGRDTTGGASNTFIGFSAGTVNLTGSQNVFLGASSGGSNSSGSYNSFLGFNAGNANTTGWGNSAVGYYAALNTKTGSANAVFGSEAGKGVVNNSFSSSTLVGYRAGYGLTTGNDNVFLGFQAGYSVTTGTGNIVIGYAQDLQAPTTNNQLNIGGVLFGNLAEGTIGISTRTPVSALDVNGTLTLRGNLNSAGDLTVRSSAIGSSVTIQAAYGNLNTSGNVLIKGGSYNGGSNGANGGHVVIAAGELASGTGGFNMHAGSVTISAGDSYSAEATATGGSVILNAGAGGAGTSGTLQFKVGGAEKVRILNSGAVGIGTASPNYRLDVQGGNINASGGMCIADNCVSSWSSVTGVWTKAGSVIYPMSATDNVLIKSTLTVEGNAFSVGGSLLAVNQGKVGIGFGAPAALLDVRDTGASSGFVLRVGTGTASDSASLVVTTGGIVGVGTLFPSTQTVFHAQAMATDRTPGVEDVTAGVMGSVRVNGTGSEDAATGGDFESRADGVQNISYLVGVHTAVERTSGGTGYVGKAIGLYVDDMRNSSAGTGKITDTYGVFIGTMATDNQTNAPYSVFAVDQNARSYFAGKVGLGTANPQYALEVSSAAGSSDKILMVSTGTVEIFSVKGNGEVYTKGKFIGDGSSLTNVYASNVIITGSGLSIATSAYAGASGVIISSGGAVQTTGAGHGSVSGNARGLGAVDLQTFRASAGQVAGGEYSVIAGGKLNSAAGPDSAVAGGMGNAADGYYSGALSGYYNAVTGGATSSLIAGGEMNTVNSNAVRSFIGGGYGNYINAQADFAAIAGGKQNVIGGGTLGSAVLGGSENKVYGSSSAIAGGGLNVVSSTHAFIGGGRNNRASGLYSVVGGGDNNEAINAAFVGGGQNNFAHGGDSVVAGGNGNKAGAGSAVLGGTNNVVDGYSAAVAGGSGNSVNLGADGTFIGGGVSNIVTASYSAIGGGQSNVTQGTHSFTGGGMSNLSAGQYSFVGGGYQNKAVEVHSAVAGGWFNQANGMDSFVGGGKANVVWGAYSFVGGGGPNGGVTGNIVDGSYSSIVGGSSNTIASVASMGFIGGGSDNHLYGDASVIGGGSRNAAGVGGIKYYAAVLGGHDNQAVGEASFVGAGNYNIASGQFAMVPGGANNTASGDLSFAAGYRSSSTVNGAFSWADSEGYPLVNDIPNQTRFKAKGGFWVAISTDYNKPGLFVSSANNVAMGVVTGGPGARLTVIEPNPQPDAGNIEVLRVGTGPFPGMLSVSTNGVVGMSMQSVAIASAPPMALAGTGWNPINSFNFEEIDTQNEMTTAGFTTRNPGRYLVTFDATMQCAIANNTVGVGVGVNGEAVPARYVTSYVGATGQNAVSFSHVFNLSAGSLLQFYFYNTLASAFNNFVPMVTVTKLN